mmetsp:Transcript_20550/g.41140  ORF Transcript_20550/g.41140 Transcript_20550/m.41140 type:complete len:80 (-) Transcript_20550:968-1207(-)
MRKEQPNMMTPTCPHKGLCVILKIDGSPAGTLHSISEIKTINMYHEFLVKNLSFRDFVTTFSRRKTTASANVAEFAKKS